jgi:erythrocyte band 7 integral membrane protein
MLDAGPAKLILEGIGLNIAKNLNSIYGEKYSAKPKDSAGAYAGCMRGCGGCCQSSCLVCASCNCGPVQKISTGHIGLLIEFGRLVKKLPPGLHVINPCS